MYKFYKIFPNGSKKYCATFESTLDPEYHAYINWCRENEFDWELIRVFDNKVMFQSEYVPVTEKVLKKIPELNVITFSMNVDGTACLFVKIAEHIYIDRKVTREEMQQHPNVIADMIKREAKHLSSLIND